MRSCGVIGMSLLRRAYEVVLVIATTIIATLAIMFEH
jgi:hypothetical protein